MRIIDWSSDVCSSDLTSHIACQYGALGIRCNNVAPGVTVTPMVAGRLEDPLFKRINVEMTPNKRLGEIEDVASTTAFLCSKRPERRRVGKEWFSTGRPRWVPERSKKKKHRIKT